MINPIDLIFINQQYFLALITLLIIVYFYLYKKIKESVETRYIQNDINLRLLLTIACIVVLIAGMSVYYDNTIKGLFFKYNDSVMNKDMLNDEVNYYKKL